MRRILFLDRDGVLNRDRGEYTWRIEDFELLPGVIDGLREISSRGYELIIITNQGGIAKGLYTHDDVDRLHAHMKSILDVEGISITEIYYCPHHPEHGKCLCRKPGSLMLEKAVARFGIDTSMSYMIGDMDRDVKAATAAGVQGILVHSNSNFIDTINKLPWNESLNS
ncbi:MAG: D-glycero-alpha-D-manno-heptose-1,7-bisphosphate 7-phosphatase [Bacteroidota bacterium]